jgi:hypothetical protein
VLHQPVRTTLFSKWKAAVINCRSWSYYLAFVTKKPLLYVSAFSLCYNSPFNHISQDGLLCTIRSWLSFFPSSTSVVTSLVFMIPFDFQLGPLQLPNSNAFPEELSWVLNMDSMLKSWRREDRLPDTRPRLNSRFIQINEMAAESVYRRQQSSNLIGEGIEKSVVEGPLTGVIGFTLGIYQCAKSDGRCDTCNKTCLCLSADKVLLPCFLKATHTKTKHAKEEEALLQG